jgi:hypothetical protein
MPKINRSLRSKSEQLVDYSRVAISTDRLADPLPGTRR